MPGLSLRLRTLAAGAVASCGVGLLAGCALPGPAPRPAAAAAVQASAATAPVAQRLAEGVYLLPGRGGVADAGNLGRIGNAGFIVGPRGVLAIDTGTSLAHGRALLAAIHAVTDQPVRLVLVTQARPEFLFGGNAFREAGIPVQMHRRTAQLMASRCETCLRALVQQLGEAAMAGTTMYTPDGVFDGALTLELIGRPVQVLQHGHSSGPGDIAVFDPASGVLFAGGLLDAGRIPDIQDSVLPGWQQALAELAALRPSLVVPGHGPASTSALIGTVARYLAQLEARCQALLAEGASLIDVADLVELPEFAGWDEYDTIHRRNASIAFLRLERELLLR